MASSMAISLPRPAHGLLSALPTAPGKQRLCASSRYSLCVPADLPNDTKSCLVRRSRDAKGTVTTAKLDGETNETPPGASSDKSLLDILTSAAVADIHKAILSAACIAAVGSTTLAVPIPAHASADLACANINTYYASTTGLTGPALRTELRSIINNHKVYSYTQAWEALKVLDAADERDPVNSKDVLEIYTRKRAEKSLAADKEGWNREHLWPRSYGLVQGEPEFSDLHNLRPADVNVNSARGNKWYGECSQASEPDSGCLRPANREAAPDTAATKRTWTPPSEVRGDIARALLYMDLRYDGRGDGSTHDLVLSDFPNIAQPMLVAAAAPAAPAAMPVPVAPAPTTSTPLTPSPSVTPPAGSSASTNSTSSSSNTSSTATSPAALAAAKPVQFPGPLPAWLNELHYDNIGKDDGEFLEVITRPGVKPEDITVALYNGNDGKIYATYKLSQFAPGSKIAGFTAFSLTLPTNGIQNGPADGVALFQKTSGVEKVVQFVSYEGGLVALEGPAKGFKSVDIGVAQNDKTPKGTSLGLTGKGKDFKDFCWGVLGKATFGTLNPGQSISP